MARDPLLVLQTVRRRSVEAARYELGACLTHEAAAADKIRAIDEAAQKDRAAHPSLEAAHQFIEMFARRTAAAEAERRAAVEALAAAQARSADARAAVVAARTAAEAVATLIAERSAAAEAEANRRDQHTLDDMTRNLAHGLDRANVRGGS
jgi:pantoate kinase